MWGDSLSFLRITDHDMFSEHYANKTKCPTQVRELILIFFHRFICLQGKRIMSKEKEEEENKNGEEKGKRKGIIFVEE